MTDKEKVMERYRARIKRQNDKIKTDYDRISATLPKGTVDRIRSLGLTINGVVNDAVLNYLDCMEEPEHQAENASIPNYAPEPIVEPQKEVSEPVEKVEKKPKKAEFKPITPEEAAELQALIDGKKAEEKRAKEKAEQEKKAREEAEQAEKEAEIMGYVEKMRAAQEDIRGARSEQDQKKIAAVLADTELLAIIREPLNKDCLVEQIGEELFNAILRADREKQRKESIDLASVEMRQTGKPPF